MGISYIRITAALAVIALTVLVLQNDANFSQLIDTPKSGSVSVPGATLSHVDESVTLDIDTDANVTVFAVLNGPGVVGGTILEDTAGENGSVKFGWKISEAGNYTATANANGTAFDLALEVIL